MNHILDDGKAIAFGQRLKDVERLFGFQAADNPSPVARKGIDKILRTKNLSLEFDSGKLHSIVFEQGYEFKNPPTPYPEPWKNFVVIGSTAISCGMARDKFLEYLGAWAERAKGLGAEKAEPGDLTVVQFNVSITQDEFVDMVHISMGPSRRAGGGGIWSDGWTLFFSMKSNPRHEGHPVGTLQSLSAFRDEFNTVARRT